MIIILLWSIFAMIPVSLFIMYRVEFGTHFKVGDRLISVDKEEWEDKMNYVVSKVGKNNYLIHNEDLGYNRTISFRMANLCYEKKETL